MTARRKKQKFKLIGIADFDARRGYKRCGLPGVGLTIPPPAHAWWLTPTRLTSDFWRRRDGALVVRLSSNYHNVFHYEVTLANGKPVADNNIEEFSLYILEVLEDWGGTDDEPNESFII